MSRPRRPNPSEGPHQAAIASGVRSVASTASGDALTVLVDWKLSRAYATLTCRHERLQAVQRVRPALVAHVEAVALGRQAVVTEVERRSRVGVLNLEGDRRADPLGRERRLLHRPYDPALLGRPPRAAL